MNTPETFHNVLAINVDVQNDFLPGGSLAVPHGDDVIEPLNALNHWVRERHGDPVIFTADWHPKKTPHFKQWPVHCVRYTAGAAFPDNLDVRLEDNIAQKGMMGSGYSGWHAQLTPDSPLYERGNGRYLSGVRTVTELVDGMAGTHTCIPRSLAICVGGLATDYCVRATVLDGLQHAQEAEKYNPGVRIGIFVVENAIRAVNLKPKDGEQAREEMADYGATFVTTDQIISGEAFRIKR